MTNEQFEAMIAELQSIRKLLEFQTAMQAFGFTWSETSDDEIQKVVDAAFQVWRQSNG